LSVAIISLLVLLSILLISDCSLHYYSVCYTEVQQLLFACDYFNSWLLTCAQVFVVVLMCRQFTWGRDWNWWCWWYGDWDRSW